MLLRLPGGYDNQRDSADQVVVVAAALDNFKAGTLPFGWPVGHVHPQVHGATAAGRQEHGLRALSSLRARFTQVAYFPNLKGRLGVDRFGLQDSRERFDV